MCNFLSGLVLKNGTMIIDPEHTDSHEDLIEFRGLKDTDQFIRKFARFEFTPKSHKTIADVDSYTLKIDEYDIPDWCDEEMKDSLITKLKIRIERMIVTVDTSILLGGCWILSGDVRVNSAKNARIVSMHGSSSVNYMYGSSSVNSMHDSSSVVNDYRIKANEE